MTMNLKEWYTTYKRGEWSNVLPVFKVDSDNKAEDIVKELERLEIFSGNMCAKVENARYIDVWFSDFYNTFHEYTMWEGTFVATLAELKEIQNV